MQSSLDSWHYSQRINVPKVRMCGYLWLLFFEEGICIAQSKGEREKKYFALRCVSEC